MVTPAIKREAVAAACVEHELSERRACQLVGIGRSSRRYRGRRPSDTELRTKLCELAQKRRRWGYRRLGDLLDRQGEHVNHKRVYRVYREEKLQVRRRRRRRMVAGERVRLIPAKEPNQRWSMDFVRDTLASGRPFRSLNVLDEFTREALAIEVAASIPGARVTRVLDRVVATHGKPFEIIIDNGPEFIGKALDQWAFKHGVRLHFIRPGKPMENGYIESFNGKYRDEFLNDNWFESIAEAAEKAEAWRVDYNEQRPHQGLGRRTPAEVRAEYERGCAASAEGGSNEGIVAGALFNAGSVSQSDAQ
jgi:putative transposase